MQDAPDELRFLAARSADRDIRGNDSGESGDESEPDDPRDDDFGDDLPHVAHPDQPISNDRPPEIRRGGNTGPKGVLADYAEAKRHESQRREAEKQATMERLQKMAFTVNSRMDNKPPEDEDDEDDDDFMREYRKKRLAELQQAQRPTFGFLRSIDSAEYVDAIDAEKKDVFVVVHLYKNEIRECVILNHILQSLAIKYPYVKFLKIISTEAKPDYDDVGLPSLLVYQGGNLLQCWVPITVKLGKNFEAANVELLLARANIIKPTAIDKTGIVHRDKGLDEMRKYDFEDYSDEGEDDD